MTKEQSFNLSPEKRELLARLLREKGVSDSRASATIPARPKDAPPPLSFAQERLWYLEKLVPGKATYNIPVAVRLEGPLNISVLHKSLNHIVQRHEVLRTTFDPNAVEPRQKVLDAMSVALPLETCSSKQDWQEILSNEAQKPFNFETGPLLRAKIIRIGTEKHIFLFTIHHIIADGWSLAVFFKELSGFYTALLENKTAKLPPITVQYGDFAIWQRQRLSGRMLDSQLDYWQKQLDKDLPVLSLPKDRPHPQIPSYQGGWFTEILPPSLVKKLKQLSHHYESTLFVVFSTALSTLLYRYSGQQKIILGTAVTNRIRPELETLIGHFVNTMALPINISGQTNFQDLIQRQKRQTLDAYTNQDIPFEYLLTSIQPTRDLRQNPIFQVLFILQDIPAQANWRTALNLPHISAEQLFTHSQTAKMDLTVVIEEEQTRTTLSFEYNADIFNLETIKRMAGHFLTLLEGIVTNPTRPVSDYPLLTISEKRQISIWNETNIPIPDAATIHHLFEEQANRTPEAKAIIFDQQVISYQTLNDRSNQLANLLTSWGVGPEIPVGIFMHRAIELVVGLLAILKAGGFYVPLDPEYPPERIQFMLADTAAPVILTTSDLLPNLSGVEARIFCLDRDWESVEDLPTTNPDAPIAAQNLAYVIYTSGSTGRPKGVAISHQAAVAMLSWAASEYSANVLAGTLAVTSICFDLSIYELFLPLSKGGKIILAENALHLIELPARNQITLINTVPSAMTELLKADAIPESVKIVNLAGEPLPRSLVQAIYEKSNVQAVYNLYGPSEDTTYSTFTMVDRNDSAEPTIGKPISNTQAHIVDDRMQPLPIGITGELFLGGFGISRGYLNRPGLTADRYIPNPFSDHPGARLYRTGDLAHLTPNGEIVFQGRVDHQVKVRGYRIELGEIKVALNQFSSIESAIVLVHNNSNGSQIVAYVIPKGKSSLTPHILKHYLQTRLPHFMIPAVFVILDSFPLTPNGKVDRKALPDPTHQAGPTTKTMPTGNIEETIAEVWHNVLQLEIEKVGRHDNFFDLGGNSLMLLHVHNQLQQIFGETIPIVRLFTASTVAAIAQFLGQENVSSTTMESSEIERSLNRGQLRRARTRRRI